MTVNVDFPHAIGASGTMTNHWPRRSAPTCPYCTPQCPHGYPLTTPYWAPPYWTTPMATPFTYTTTNATNVRLDENAPPTN